MKFLSLVLFCFLVSNVEAQIERRLPPVGMEIPDDVRDRVTSRLAELRAELDAIADHPQAADADILLKAVGFAVRHREVYKPDHLKLLDETLALAGQRIDGLRKDDADWQAKKLTAARILFPHRQFATAVRSGPSE